MTTIGIIGGTGLYSLDGIDSVREIKVDTPFGSPSDVLVTGEIGPTRLIFVPRHGRGHRLLPAEVPYQANIFALKSLGAEWVISISAVGSMQEAIHPGDIVLPDQFIDRTRSRPATFFGDGLCAHVALADPFCATLAQFLATEVQSCGIRCHVGGTYVCIEGPAFSTRAESQMFRSWNASVIGMTAVPEVRLAREAELHYATVALVTDYDCWHETETDVTVDAVLATLRKNTANIKKVLERVLPKMVDLETTTRKGITCDCPQALRNAIVTGKEAISAEKIEILGPLVQKYV